MADIVDLGNDRAEEMLQDALNTRKREHLPPKGRCYNCDESVPVPHRFCDADCRDDWEKRNKVLNGQFADNRNKEVDDETV